MDNLAGTIIGIAIFAPIAAYILWFLFRMLQGGYRALFWSRERLCEQQWQAERERRAIGSLFGSDRPGYDPDQSRASLFWSSGAWLPLSLVVIAIWLWLAY